MNGFAARAKRAYVRGGFVYLLQAGFDRIAERLALAYRERVRPRLPDARHARWNGVLIARRTKRFDFITPDSWKPVLCGDIPTYENALIAGLVEHVKPGDRIVVVGGGYGVTAITAARLTGPTGAVTCYEAVEDRVADIHTAIRLNGIPAAIHVEHCIVAEAISLFGESGAAPLLPPTLLPTAHVLQLDCEGAEVQILRSMTIRPRVILVETHGGFGAPTPLVRQLLEELGYQVEDLGLAEVGQAEACERNDIRVLSGIRGMR
jgi:hypothetical protein